MYEVYYDSRKLDLATFGERIGMNVDDNLLFSDGVHPSELTYQLWAEHFSKFIQEKLKSKKA